MITEHKIMVISWVFGFVLRFVSSAIREDSTPIELIINAKTIETLNGLGALFYLVTFTSFVWWLL